jgi:cbb3-type cytochrome oxidase subunit 3
LASYDKQYDFKPKTRTPSKTFCYYKLEYSTKFTDNFTIERDVNTELSLRSSSDGVQVDLTPVSKRMLNNEKRLLTTTETYEVTNADYVEIYYGANSELSSSNFVITSTQSYYEPPPDTSEGGDSSSSAGIIIAVGVVIPLVLLATVAIVVIFICYRRKRRRRNAREPPINFDDLRPAMPVNRRSVQSLSHESSGDTLPQVDEVRNIFEKMVDMRYNIYVDKFEAEMCPICQESFEKGDPVRLIESCKHIFHSKCIKQMLETKYNECLEIGMLPTEDLYKCPN